MFQQVVGTAVAYLDLDASKFNTGLQTAWSQLKGIGDQSLTLDQKFQSVGQGLQTVGSNMTRTLTVPIAGAFAIATKKTMDFEEAMSNVKALSGATGDDFDALREKAIELGGSTKFTSKEVADAFGYMALAGWKTEDMINGIAGVLDLAASSGMDLARASDIVTDYLSAFGKEAGYSAHMADMMSYAQANTNTTTEMLGDAFGNSAALMHTAGQEMDTTIALLGMLANEGLKGSEAGTALSATMRDIYQKMSLVEDESKAAALAQDGLSSSTGNMNDLIGKQVIQIGKVLIPVSDANGKFRDMIDILADVEKATNGLESAEKTAALQQTFTSRSIKGMSILLTEGADKTRDFREELQEADGTANEMSKTMLDNLAGSITYLTSALDNFLIKVGDRIAPYIRKIADFITELTNKLTSMSDEEFDNMVKIAGTVALLGPALSILGKISSSIGGIIGLFGKLSGAGKMISTMTNGCHSFGSCVGDTAGKVTNLGGAFSKVAGVIGGVIKTIGGIAAVIGGTALAVKEFFNMWENGWNMLSTILEAIGIALATIGAIILGAPAAIAAAVGAIVLAVSQLAIVIHDHWDEIKQWFSDLIENIKEKWQKFKDWLSKLWEGIVDFFKGIGEGISNAFNGAIDWIKEKWNEFVEWFTELWNGFSDTVENVCNAISGLVEDAIGWIKEKWEDFKEWFKGLWDKIVATVSDAFDSISKWMEEIWKTVTTKAKDIVGEVGKKLNEVWDNIVEFFKNVWESVSGFFKDLWETLTEKWSEITKGVSEFFKEVWGIVSDWFSDLIKNIGEFFGDLIKNIKEWFGNLGKAISDAFNGVKEIVDKVIDAIEKAWDGFVTFIKDAFGAVIEFIEGAVGDLQKVVEEVGEAIGDFFEGILESLGELWKNVKDFIGDIFEKIYNFITESLKKLWDWVKDFPSKFVEIGGKIISGLWEGLKAAWGPVKDWFEDKFGWISDIVGKISGTFGGIRDTFSGLFNGSHVNGLDYVPFDGYVAQLHKGERVLTKQQNEEYNRNYNSSSGGDTFNFYNTQPDPYEYARQMKRAKKELLYT